MATMVMTATATATAGAVEPRTLAMLADETTARLLVNWDTANRSEATNLRTTLREILVLADNEGRDRRKLVKKILLIAFRRRNHLKSQADGDGAGERNIFVETILAIASVDGEFDDLLTAVLPLVPLYGCWRDLRLIAERLVIRHSTEAALHPLAQEICRLFAEQMLADDAACLADESSAPSNACKYAPHSGRNDAGSKKRKREEDDDGEVERADTEGVPLPTPPAGRGGRGGGRGGRGGRSAGRGRGGRVGGRGRGSSVSTENDSQERHAANKRLSKAVQAIAVPEAVARGHGGEAYRKLRSRLNQRLTTRGHLMESLLCSKQLDKVNFYRVNKGALAKYSAAIRKDANAKARWSLAMRKSSKAVPDLESFKEAIEKHYQEISEDVPEGEEPFSMLSLRVKKALETMRKKRLELLQKAQDIYEAAKAAETTVEEGNASASATAMDVDSIVETKKGKKEKKSFVAAAVPCLVMIDTCSANTAVARAMLVLAGLLMTLTQDLSHMVIDGHVVDVSGFHSDQEIDWIAMWVPTEPAVELDNLARVRNGLFELLRSPSAVAQERVDVVLLCQQFVAYSGEENAEAVHAFLAEAQSASAPSAALRTFRVHRMRHNVPDGEEEACVVIPYVPRTERGRPLPAETTDMSADLLFVVDFTGSMGSYMAAVKKELVALINEVKDSVRLRHVRVGLVGYRDYSDEGRVVTVDFRGQEECAEVVAAIQGQQASGGGDAPEDLLSGLVAAGRLAWESDVRIQVIITDAPAHGYCEYGGDDYKSGRCPDQREEDGYPSLVQAAETLANAHEVDTLFCVLQVGVVKTVEALKEVYPNGGFGTVTLSAASMNYFRDRIVAAISQAILTSVTAKDVSGLQTADGVSVSSVLMSMNASVRETCADLGLEVGGPDSKAEKGEKAAKKAADSDWVRLQRDLKSESLTPVRLALHMPVSAGGSSKLSAVASAALFKAGLTVALLQERDYPEPIVKMFQEYLQGRLGSV